MARLGRAKCPNCGASIQVHSHQHWAACSNCGTKSLVAQSGSAPLPPGQRSVSQGPPSSERAGSGAGGVIVIALALAVVVGVVVTVVVASSSDKVDRSARPSESRTGTSAAAEPSTTSSADPEGLRRLTSYRVLAAERPLLSDVDGDGMDDLLVQFSATMNGKGQSRYAAFSGKTGKLVWVTSPLENDHYTTTAAGSWLLLADGAGRLYGLHLRDGARAWTTALGAEGKQFCKAPEPNTILVGTADERLLVVDLRTGAQKPAPANATCRPAQTNSRTVPNLSRIMRAVQRQNGLNPNELAQLDEIHCGSLRVLGDAGSQVLADACTKLLGFEPESVEPFRIDEIRRFDENAWVLLGVRQPGVKVPMIGLARSGRVIWSKEVPDGSPMLAKEGAPRLVQVHGQTLAIGYEQKEHRGSHVTAIAADTGDRLWDVVLPTGGQSIQHLLVASGRLYATTQEAIVALDATTGRQLFVLGNGGRAQAYPWLPD